jgi:hypothetical protein
LNITHFFPSYRNQVLQNSGLAPKREIRQTVTR